MDKYEKFSADVDKLWDSRGLIEKAECLWYDTMTKVCEVGQTIDSVTDAVYFSDMVGTRQSVGAITQALFQTLGVTYQINIPF
jgi:hypothetical protein